VELHELTTRFQRDKKDLQAYRTQHSEEDRVAHENRVCAVRARRRQLGRGGRGGEKERGGKGVGERAKVRGRGGERRACG